jgi:RNA polymerase sigma-70 factor (ECF subfamily)
MKVIVGEVVARAQQGERAAQRELYDQYADAVFGYVLNLLGSREEAVELAQDIWLRVFRRLNTLRDPQAFHAWLFQIAANMVRDHLKRAKPPTIVSLDQPDGDDEDDERIPEVADASGDPSTVAAQNELQQRIQKALKMLPPERREVVILHHLEGFGVREIADQLGIAVGTVKSRLGRGRARMRELLADLIEAT